MYSLKSLARARVSRRKSLQFLRADRDDDECAPTARGEDKVPRFDWSNLFFSGSWKLGTSKMHFEKASVVDLRRQLGLVFDMHSFESPE